MAGFSMATFQMKMNAKTIMTVSTLSAYIPELIGYAHV